ncbi:MAG: hypothetical protein ACPG5B_10470 [Chitinophagales bacterium]
MQKNKDFIQLFRKREGKALLGEKSQNLKKLSAIFLLTFLVIGFAKGSLDYLDKKINSPFVKLVEMSVPFAETYKMKNIQADLAADSLKKKYNYAKIEPYKNYPLTVCYHEKSKKKGSNNVTGRTIEHDNFLLNKIYDDNTFEGKPFGRGDKAAAKEDIGLIVTQKMLSKFGYAQNTPYLLLDITADVHDDVKRRESIKVPVPIRAVVENLPSSKEIIYTPYFYYQRSPNIKKNNGNTNTFDPSLNHLNKKQLYYLLSTTDETKIDAFIEVAGSFFETESSRLSWGEMRANTDDEHNFNGGTWLSIWFSDTPDSLTLNDMSIVHNKLMKDKKKELEQFDFVRTFQYDFSRPLENQQPDYDYLSISLESLTNVKEMRAYIFSKHQLEIDLSKVEALKNYNFVATLTIIISFALIAFSIISISMFVSNLLSTHLDKIKMNLGTFKAFGLDNLTLQNIYKKMMYEIVGKAAAIGFLGAFVLGMFYVMRMLLSLFIFAQQKLFDIQSNSIEVCDDGFFAFTCENYFSLINTWTLLSVMVIGLIIHFTINRVIKKILQKSPGDLIYNR